MANGISVKKMIITSKIKNISFHLWYLGRSLTSGLINLTGVWISEEDVLCSVKERRGVSSSLTNVISARSRIYMSEYYIIYLIHVQM